jgi:two-component system, cell cycle sensor histidine kinase and response regulator CckA
MWVFDLETLRFLAVNDAAVSHYGYSREEFLRLTIVDIRPPEDVPQLMKELANEPKGGITGSRHHKKDGTIIDVEISAQRLVFAKRNAQLVLALDITARKQAEMALRESEERYRDLVENAHDIIYSHDLKGNYTSVNKAGEATTGYTREEALKLNLVDTVAPEWRDKAKDMMRRKLEGERVTAYEMELIAKDGRRVAVEVNTKLVYANGKPVAVQGIARDVTERKQLEEQLRQSQKMEAIGQLAGGVAHDFNNLLTAIIGYSGLALQRMEDESPLKPYIEEIKKAGDRAANLTRQLLAFGRKQILQPLPLNLNDVITDLNKMLRRLIGEDIRLAARLDLDLKKIKADPGQIEQVLMNLVVNARDAMPRGGNLTIETANVQIDEEYAGRHIGVNSGAYVMLAVSDNGTGMDQETESKIFEPFFTTKDKGKGTGLGLSTVYGIVKQSGGNIWVYSEMGHGTTFKIYLPQVDDAVGTEQAKPQDDSIPGGSETVLLVEDEEVVRGLAQRILKDAGYRVITANGGEEAITWCANNTETIHLLLTDVVMPDTSGKELAERLSSLRPQTKVLFMSGYTDEAIVHHGVLDSNVEFIQKPFTPTALSRKVRQVLDSNGHSK